MERDAEEMKHLKQHAVIQGQPLDRELDNIEVEIAFVQTAV